MLSVFLVIALQAATTQQAALASATEQTASEETADAASVEPARKRVCRTVIDNSTGPIAKRRKICRFVDDADSASN